MNHSLKNLVKTAAIYGSGQVFHRFLSFLLLPVFTCYLSPKDFGIMAILGLISIVAARIFSFGVGVSMGICYFGSDSLEERMRTLWTTFFILLAGALLLCGAGFGFAKPMSRLAFQDVQYHHLISITVLGVCFTILCEPFVLYLQFENRASLFVILAAFSNLVSLGLNVGMVAGLKMGVYGMTLSTALGQAVSFLFFLWFCPRARWDSAGSNAANCSVLEFRWFPPLPSYLFCDRAISLFCSIFKVLNRSGFTRSGLISAWA